MSLSGTQEGGSLMFIDAANYSEQNTPANSTVPASGGQSEVTDKPLNQGLRPVAVRPRHDALPAVGRHQPRAAGLPAVRGDAQRRRRPLRNAHRRGDRAARATSNMTREQRAADPVQDNVPPSYAIYMFDPGRRPG